MLNCVSRSKLSSAALEPDTKEELNPKLNYIQEVLKSQNHKY